MLLWIALSALIGAVCFLGGKAFPYKRIQHALFALGRAKEFNETLQGFCGLWTCVHRTKGFSTVKELVRDTVVITLYSDVDFGHNEQILISRRLRYGDPPCPFFAGGYEKELMYSRHKSPERPE